MLVSHFLKAPDFSTWLGSWGGAEPPCKAEQRQAFLPGIHSRTYRHLKGEGNFYLKFKTNFKLIFFF